MKKVDVGKQMAESSITWRHQEAGRVGKSRMRISFTSFPIEVFIILTGVNTAILDMQGNNGRKTKAP
jgi:hypothetical protein